MLRKMVAAGAVRQGWRRAASKTQNISSTVDSMILRSLKDHYVDISKMNPLFRDLDEGTRDALHSYVEERGVNENLFPFFQAWPYVKEHRTVLHWLKRLGTFVSENKSAKDVIDLCYCISQGCNSM